MQFMIPSTPRIKRGHYEEKYTMEQHTTTRSIELIHTSAWTFIARLFTGLCESVRKTRHARIMESLPPHLQRDAGHTDHASESSGRQAHYMARRRSQSLDQLRLP